MSNDDGGILFSDRLFFAPWGWWAYDVSHLGTTAWSIMEAEDFNPWVLGGDSGDFPGRTPRVRVEAMATGKSAGFTGVVGPAKQPARLPAASGPGGSAGISRGVGRRR